MPDEHPLILNIEVAMEDREYLIWNVTGCVRELRDAPHEHEITLLVYEIHKDVLRRHGVSDDDLKIGDRYVEQAKTKYLRGMN